MSEEVTNQKKPEAFIAEALATQEGQKALTETINATKEFDPALLLVKGKFGENKQYIKSLAHAVVTVIGKYGYANLKCVGASSVNNAIKSFTIASGEAKMHGLNLVLSAGFQNAMFDDVEKTAMVFKVFDR